MRRTTKTEQERAEIEASERTDRRKGGFDLMKVRDRGWWRMSNGLGMVWHTNSEPAEYEARRSVPDGMFLLQIGREEVVCDKEEFMRWLRWV